MIDLIEMEYVVNDAHRLLLRMNAEPGNLSPVREAVGEHAQEFGLGPQEVDDLRTVVSEACANVIRHAYPADAVRRPLEVELIREGSAVTVAVRDEGVGIRPNPDADPPTLRLGLVLIGALANCFQLRSTKGRGTELAVSFAPAGAAW